jgi:hypothetical protein
MIVPSCPRCGSRLRSLSELDRYGGAYYDCYKKGKQEETLVLAIFV